MRLKFLFYLASLFVLVFSDTSFIYPPAFVSTTNFSSNIIMVEGDFKIVQWTNVSNPNNARISVTMFQLNGTQFFGNEEYVIQNAAPDTVSTSWTVNTAKNLTLSPMFFLTVFIEGETAGLANSHYFNISATSTTTIATSTQLNSIGTISTTASTSSSQTSTSALPAATISTSPPSPSIITISSSLSIGAKVGIAVGVVGAALLGISAGWLILGRRTKTNNVQMPLPVYGPAQTSYYEPAKMPQQYPHEVASEPTLPVVYELSPEMRQ